MELTFEEASYELNNKADMIRKKLCSSRQEAMDFLIICERSKVQFEITNKKTGEALDWREAPDEVVFALALQAFDQLRKKMTH